MEKAELVKVATARLNRSYPIEGVCESGDACHVFSMLLSIFQMPIMVETNRFEMIHFMVLVLKPAALVKMVIIDQ